jgi:hypothetical protein
VSVASLSAATFGVEKIAELQIVQGALQLSDDAESSLFAFLERNEVTAES